MALAPSATARMRCTSTSRSTRWCHELRLFAAFYSVSLAHERDGFLHALFIILLYVAARIQLFIHRHEIGVLALQQPHEMLLRAAIHVHHHGSNRSGAR